MIYTRDFFIHTNSQGVYVFLHYFAGCVSAQGELILNPSPSFLLVSLFPPLLLFSSPPPPPPHFFLICENELIDFLL